MTTTKRLLTEHLYDGDLDADVRKFLDARMSWREIAERVSTRSGVSVSYETVRQWFGTDERKAS